MNKLSIAQDLPIPFSKVMTERDAVYIGHGIPGYQARIYCWSFDPFFEEDGWVWMRRNVNSNVIYYVLDMNQPNAWQVYTDIVGAKIFPSGLSADEQKFYISEMKP